MQINSNLSALSASNNLKTTEGKRSKVLEKLSSGARINRASDDAAGLAISEKMRAQIRGLDQASRNIQDGISLIQTAEGGLANISEPPLQRMRELAVQAANGTYTTQDRQAMQAEIEQIKQEIDGIANDTEFNGISLLNRVVDLTVPPPTILGMEINSRLSGYVNNIFGINTVNGQLMASYYGGILTSADGVDWSNNNTSANAYNIKIASNGSSFVAVGSCRDILYSSDGLDWTLQNHQGGIGEFHDVIWDGNQYIAVGGLQIPGGGLIYASSDGLSWTQLAINVSTNDINGIIYDGSKYVAVTSYGKIMTSTDATIWNIVADNLGTLLDINWNGSRYVAVGNMGKIFSSEDGATWTVQNSGAAAACLRGIAWNGSQYMVVGDENNSTGIILTSVDGNSWNSAPLGNQVLKDVTSIGEKFVMVGLDGDIYDAVPTVPTPILESTLLLQVGANSNNSLQVQLVDARSAALGVDTISLESISNANDAIAKIDDALNMVSSARSAFGATQNALEHLASNVTNSSMNLAAAESGIRDVNMAKTMTQFVGLNILAQATQAMLAQANKLNEDVLQLLKSS